MAVCDVFNISAEKIGEIELQDSLFNVEINTGLLVKQDGEGITIALDYFTDKTFRNAVTYSQKQIKSYSILEVRSK